MAKLSWEHFFTEQDKAHDAMWGKRNWLDSAENLHSY